MKFILKLVNIVSQFVIKIFFSVISHVVIFFLNIFIFILLDSYVDHFRVVVIESVANEVDPLSLHLSRDKDYEL